MNDALPLSRSPFAAGAAGILDGKSILVTGGTGSFGQAFIQEALEQAKPARLVIYSRDEQKQFEMAQRFRPEVHRCLRYFMGDVRDIDRLKRAFFGIDYVIHAAALKHVPIAEYNPIEAIKTNIVGGENIINAAIDAGVKKVIALSTDKAANPVNLYGATKLCSDKLFVAANNLAGRQQTIFSVVRYGNVIGSRGSVVPHFRRLVADKIEYLPITDPRMTRFWISIKQGVRFVLSCLGSMEGGELFVPKIPSMKVVDLVEAIAPGYPTKVVGIRPGEKLHESMLTSDDAINTLEFQHCYLIRPTGVYKLQNKKFTLDGEAGAAVAEDFQYRSDLNSQWLTSDQLHALLAETGGVR